MIRGTKSIIASRMFSSAVRILTRTGATAVAREYQTIPNSGSSIVLSNMRYFASSSKDVNSSADIEDSEFDHNTIDNIVGGVIGNDELEIILDKRISEVNEAGIAYNKNVVISDQVALAIKEFFRNEEIYTHLEADLSKLSTANEPLFVPQTVLPVNNKNDLNLKSAGFYRTVVDVKRVTTVKTRGKVFSFVALVVVGNRDGVVGFAEGNASETITAIGSATRQAFANIEYFPRYENHTLFHSSYDKFKTTKIIARPCNYGHGLVCHEIIYAACSLLGIKDISANITGSTNRKNILECFFSLLRNQKTLDDVARLRGKNFLQLKKSVNIYA